MLKSGDSIIHMTSIPGAVGFAGAPVYTVAKHGVPGLTKVAALEYSAHGLRINAAGPGFVHTPMISSLEQDATVNDMLPSGRSPGPRGCFNQVSN